MPSVSPAQAKLMNIAAHTPGGYGGVPQSVGEEFHAADKAEGNYGSRPAKAPRVNRVRRVAVAMAQNAPRQLERA